VNIVDLIGEQISLTRRGRAFKGLCPFHDDHTPSLNVDPERQIYKCFSCGAGGDVFDFVMQRERLGFREALEALAQRGRVVLPEVRRSQRTGASKERYFEVMKWAEEEYRRCFWESEAGKPAREYARSRGLTAESLRVFGIGFAPADWKWLVQRARARRLVTEQLQKCGLARVNHSGGAGPIDFFHGHLMFPIRDARGRTIAFGGRILPQFANERFGKYTNTPETPLFTKSEHVYGLDLARDAIIKAKSAVLVEGYTDCIMAHQHGLKHVVGTLGTAIGNAHVTTLKRYADRLILVLDGDKAGQDAADRALTLILGSELDVRVWSLPGDADPCEFLLAQGAEPFQQGLDSAVDALDFKLHRARQVHDLKTINGRRQALDFVLSAIAALPVLATGSASVTREIVLDRLGQRLGVPSELVRKRLRELRNRSQRGVGLGGKVRSQSVDKPQSPDEPAKSLGLWDGEVRAERELMETLLASPQHIPEALKQISVQQINTPGFRRILEACIEIGREGRAIDLDDLRLRLDDRELACRASMLAETGREKGAVERRLADVLAYFRRRREQAAASQEVGGGDLPNRDEAERQFLAKRFHRAQSRQRMTQRHAMLDSYQ
jgi:DNA primase